MTTVIEQIQISATVNGEKVTRLIEPRLSLVDFLRNELELTGTHVGCEHGVCGACTVRVNGEIVRGCLMLAVQAGGTEIMTIEGESDGGEIADLQKAFHERNAAQCGFCTPGLIMTTTELLKTNPDPNRAEIREYLSGNYCRCTGYEAIVDAIETVATERKGG
ncbi:MAG: (2Fe-2S)-binding protein [Rhodospirillales bacterium]|jgi:carbon-monoxide dehydrogenase small subunit|nr:(2Fe-2S)-binding protein [Rhodospirillales bacterium]MDP7100856.1 (2Fe-2S)-binding protein [Rhodospirillales bacterium]MDP7424300.1 (2Fe-2S)-binding protein [Rhodospirillales bacterium]MDP7624137.1 (2Fe-2S)-binding protein [Rhodospirillales bacterium]HJO87677.1 (2Fe-2S)-binding protein [Rhodospirillales bacterium]|tara:strand:+ start:857 stop:1345 length:489 start_codon:yes stop_codon:yes gene_type:complete